MAVSMLPGQTALTRMPRSANSSAATRVSAETPALEATYAPSPAVGSTPLSEEMFTIAPPSARRLPGQR